MGCPRARLHHDEPHPDPYAVYARMRADHGPVIPVELEPGVHGWMVTDYTTLITWCRDTIAFGHDARLWKDFREGRVPPDSALLPMMAPRTNALFTDGAEHTRYRKAITDAFHPVGVEQLTRITEQHANGLIDTFCEKGAADALNEYARALPLLVMNDLFGFDEEQGNRFVSAMRDLWSGVDVEKADAESERVLSEVLSAKHRQPADDVTTRLIQHRSALSDEEVIMQLLLAVGTANEPVAHLIGTGVRALLEDPSVNGVPTRAYLSEVIDQVLWRDPPITNYPVIYPRVDVSLEGGGVIEAGSPVLLAFAAANRFYLEENAEQLLDTANRAHVAWGVGDHRCPVRDEATTIAAIALRTLFSRLPDLRGAVPNDRMRWRLTTLFWVPVDLPVYFTPTPPPNRPLAAAEGTPCPPSDSSRETSTPKRPGSGNRGRSSLSSFLARWTRGS
ncbi:cytochrome P450 family protein [Nocardiopsis valliformis]|uniref:cytochrome P450 n=1 Tax=Nocardiopsis valliformis TaxID=239974 RepID=UPI00034D0300|nr:cytochrome P450 [Nocardiopsis valliformis]